MKVQIVVNAFSGGYKPQRIEALKNAFSTHGVETFLTQTNSDGSVDLEPAVDLICVAGGDGTVRGVVNSMRRAGEAKPLSIFPSGTINLMARELQYSAEPEEFVDVLLQRGGTLNAHIMKATIGGDDSSNDGAMTGSYCVTCCSAGPDSLAIASVSLSLKKRIGRIAYFAALMKLLGRWPRSQIKLNIDQQKFDCEAFFIANGSYYAGPWRLAPEASVRANEAHIVMLRKASRLDFGRFVLAILSGRSPGQLSNVTIIAGKEITAVSDNAVPVQFDGDVVGNLPLEMRMSSKTIAYE